MWGGVKIDFFLGGGGGVMCGEDGLLTNKFPLEKPAVKLP